MPISPGFPNRSTRSLARGIWATTRRGRGGRRRGWRVDRYRRPREGGGRCQPCARISGFPRLRGGRRLFFHYPRQIRQRRFQPRLMILRRNPRRHMMRVDRHQRAAALPRQIPVHRHRPRKTRIVGFELDIPDDQPPVVERRDINFDDIAVVVAFRFGIGVIERQPHQKAAACAQIDMLERPRRPFGRQPARQLFSAGKRRKDVDQRRRDQPFGMIGAPRLLGGFHVGRFQASAALTAATASFAAPPFGPPPCAMSGRPPPPCPPSAATAALTRSTALRLPILSSVTPTATDARLSLTATSIATPLPTCFFSPSTVPRSSLGSSPSTTCAINPVSPICSTAGPLAAPPAPAPPNASAFFASASSRSAFFNASASCATRAGTSSGEVLSAAAAAFSASSRPFSHWRAASPVSASIRRTHEETALSLTTLNSAM